MKDNTTKAEKAEERASEGKGALDGGERPITFRVVGPGKAGKSLGAALQAAGWQLEGYLGKGENLSGAAMGCDVLVIATPDSMISFVAGLISPNPETLVVHLSGLLGLDTLEPHPRRASLHPLVSLPSPEVGAAKLRGANIAIAGDPQVKQIVDALGGKAFELADESRALYHAAAAVASNHLVVLLGQVEHLAELAKVPFEVMLKLAKETLDNVAHLGPKAALTGPASRDDQDTIDAHVSALPAEMRPCYVVLTYEAKRMADTTGTIRPLVKGVVPP